MKPCELGHSMAAIEGFYMEGQGFWLRTVIQGVGRFLHRKSPCLVYDLMRHFFMVTSRHVLGPSESHVHGHFLNCESFGQSRLHQQQSIISVVLLFRLMNNTNPFPSVKSLWLNTSMKGGIVHPHKRGRNMRQPLEYTTVCYYLVC